MIGHTSIGLADGVFRYIFESQVKTTLVEAAWVASETLDTFLAGRYYNIARRRGSKRAAVAIGHQILKDVYYGTIEFSSDIIGYPLPKAF